MYTGAYLQSQTCTKEKYIEEQWNLGIKRAWGSRETQTETERGGKEEGETDIQRDRDRERQTCRQTDRQAGRQTGRQADRQRYSSKKKCSKCEHYKTTL